MYVTTIAKTTVGEGDDRRRNPRYPQNAESPAIGVASLAAFAVTLQPPQEIIRVRACADTGTTGPAVGAPAVPLSVVEGDMDEGWTDIAWIDTSDACHLGCPTYIRGIYGRKNTARKMELDTRYQ
jgi:hypothetical protein